MSGFAISSLAPRNYCLAGAIGSTGTGAGLTVAGFDADIRFLATFF
jgi:hypothetical protein